MRGLASRAGRAIAVALVAGLLGGASAREAPRLGISGLGSQRIEGQEVVVKAGAPTWDDLGVLVTVGIDGRVIDARVANSNFAKVDPEPGLAAARTWRFRPQSFEGRPVIAVGTIYIRYSPPEDAPDASVPFPEAASADTEITLERGPCLGSCPGYKLTVAGDGTVRFVPGDDGSEGSAAGARKSFNADNVLLTGAHVAHVDPAAVARLVGKFRDAHFFGLKGEYAARIADIPTYALTLRRGGTSKRAIDHGGGAVGMPSSVIALEDAVDAVAGIDRWVHGNVETIGILEAEGFDFRSQAAADLVAAATEPFHYQYRDRPSEPMVLALLDKGAPLDATVEQVWARIWSGHVMVEEPKARLGSVLAYRAAVAGDELLLRRMAAKGYLARLPRDRLNQALLGGAGCSPVIARALIKAGANPRTVDDLRSPLSSLATSPACKRENRRLEMVRTLIDLGVPVDGSASGWTALMSSSSPELARLLLARGANPNARYKDGTTPLLAAQDDRVALILLRAGADPRARNPGGSVRDHAIERHLPATLAWLDAHGIK